MWKRYFDFLIFYTRAKLEAESFRNFAGYLWWIIDPLFGVGIYYLLFKVMLNRGGENYIQFLFIGLIVWKWFGDSINRGSGSILSNLSLIQRLRIDKTVFPIVELLSQTWKFLIIFSLVVVLFALSGFGVSINHFSLPVVLGAQLIMTLGFSIFLSSFVPMVPDLKFLIGYCLRLLFYPSGVLFPLSLVPQKYYFIVELNPMAGLLTSYRNILMYQKPILWGACLKSTIIGVILGFFGLKLIAKFDKEYPKLC